MNEKLVTFVKNYWSYYLRLESKFLETLNYVEFDKDNFSTFSFEYLNLLLSVCSEIDVVGKMMAHEKNTSFKEEDKYNNIYKWWYEIQDNFDVETKKLEKQETVFLRKETLIPWIDFRIEKAINKKGSDYFRLAKATKAKTPSWWTAYNHVKHNRTVIDTESKKVNYTEANLENVANAFAGLYVLEKAFMYSIPEYEMDKENVNHSKLFENETDWSFPIKNGQLSINKSEKILNGV